MPESELHSLDESELLTRLAEAKETLFNLRFQLVTGQQENTAEVGKVRRNIARLNTILRQREIEAAEAHAAAATTGDNA